jgi:DNA-binding CsgD family transcriptional regulator
MRGGLKLQRNVADLIEGLHCVGPDEPSGLQLAVEVTTPLLQGDRGVAYSLRRTEEGIDAERVEGVGVNLGLVRQVFNGVLREGSSGLLAYDPARPAPNQRNRPLTYDQIVEVNGGKPGMMTRAYPRMQLGGLDQLRILICDGPVMLGYLSAFRSEPFSAGEGELYRTLVPALRHRLRLERQLGQHPVYLAALHASMEAMSTEAFLVRATQTSFELVEANTLGRAALDRDRAGVTESLRTAIRSGAHPELSVTRLALSDLPPHYLVVRRVSTSPQLEARVNVAVRDWRLTRKQAAVLERLVRGVANKVIALELGSAEGTIETHVTALLNKSGTDSRAELIARFWTMSL